MQARRCSPVRIHARVYMWLPRSERACAAHSRAGPHLALDGPMLPSDMFICSTTSLTTPV